MSKITVFLSIILVAATLAAGCSGGSRAVVSEEAVALQRAQAQRAKTESLNRQISTVSDRFASRARQSDYPLGAGDVIDIAVFQVDELNKTVRVNGRGTIILPLLGELEVAGLTAQEAEQLLVERLGEYLHDPQVSVFVSEYRSQEISVVGAVNDPGIKNVNRSRTLLEMLTLAGGLDEKAGGQVYVQTADIDPDTGERLARNTIVDLRQLLRSPEYNFILQGGDTVFVPEAGIVFVEGAVEKPGAVALEQETTVLKAIAQAGGPKYEAIEDQVQVIRQTESGEPQIRLVDLEEVRKTGENDIVLEDGDIVVVGINSFKRGWRGFWRGFAGIFSVGVGL
ncbi:MAG: hypothetical protein DWQ08_11660 [Proteobacteria bacterium]|nr:MAG: hypothetical protein DWQ08_11660 [Pseudomonadota bacterium]